MSFYAISTLTTKLFIPSPCHSFYPLLCPLFILLFLSLVSTPVWTTCLCNLKAGVYPNPGWLCYMPLLVSDVICLCVTRMANIINVPYTWVYHRLSFLPSIIHVVGIAKPWFTMFALTVLFRWCQKGEDRHDHGYFGLTWFELTSSKFSLLWLDCLALTYVCLSMSICSFGLSS